MSQSSWTRWYLPTLTCAPHRGRPQGTLWRVGRAEWRMLAPGALRRVLRPDGSARAQPFAAAVVDPRRHPGIIAVGSSWPDSLSRTRRDARTAGDDLSAPRQSEEEPRFSLFVKPLIQTSHDALHRS